MTEGETGGRGKDSGQRRRVAARAAWRLLFRAHGLVEGPQGWTRRVFARDRHSHPVSPTSERAVRFCASGALLRAAGEQFSFSLRSARGSEKANFVAPEPLAEAYRILGGIIVESFLPAFGIELIEDDEDGLTILIPSERDGEESRQLQLSWSGLLEALNDFRAVGHQGIVALMRLAVVEAAARIVDIGGAT